MHSFLLLILFLLLVVSAQGFDDTHVCGTYEPVTHSSGNLLRTSFLIKGARQASSVTEIIETYTIRTVVSTNTSVTGSLQKISSINSIKLAYPTIGEPWFNFRLNTHTVYLTINEDLSSLNITCDSGIQTGVQYNVSEIECYYKGEDILKNYKQLVQSDVSMQSSFLFNGEEMYYGQTIYRRTSTEGCKRDYGSLLVVIGIILVLLLIVALIVITILYARATFLSDQAPLA